MDFNDFIIDKGKYPVVFIGSGITRRYFLGMKSWDELLCEAYSKMGKNETEYISLKNTIRRKIKNDINSQYTDNLLYSRLAEEIEEKYEGGYLKYQNLDINKIIRYEMNTGIFESSFKLLISKLCSIDFKKTTKKYDDEFEFFCKISEKASAILTTNYDEFLEKSFHTRKPRIGDDFFGCSSYSLIHKIHGCITQPNSIIITESDYKEVNKNS